MPITGKFMGLGAAFLAASAITAHADPVCRADTGSCKPPGHDLAALPPSTAPSAPNSVTLPEVTVFAPYSNRGIGPRVSSFGTIRTEHYEVPPDFDATVPLHPYTSGPWPGPGDKGTFIAGTKPPSHHNALTPGISGPGVANDQLARDVASH